jgi:hypothetical protein
LGEGGEDAKDPWRIYIRCCRNRLPAPTTSSDSRQDAPGASSETRELRDKKVPQPSTKGELGRLEGRLELIEVAENTLPEESLERERERADAAETEARMLREELARRESPWWQCLFGG